MTYRRKYDSILKQVIWLKHSSNIYRRFCETWQVLVCHSWFGNKSHRAPFIYFGQSKHKILRIKEAYLTKRQRHRETMRIIRWCSLLPKCTFDMNQNWCQNLYHKIFPLSVRYGNKGPTHERSHWRCTKRYVWCVLWLWFQTRMFKTDERNKQTPCKKYVHRYERSAISPLQFLKDCLRLPQMQLTLHTNQLHEWVT